MISYGPITQLQPSYGLFPYVGPTTMGAWCPQSTLEKRQSYRLYNVNQHGDMCSPFPEQVAGGSQGQFQPQMSYSRSRINPSFIVPRSFNSGGRLQQPPQIFAAAPPLASVPDTPRGPPRKPKQSGYAIWIGNLPFGTGIYDLKDHCARGATNEIESIFLISKSNCAFANYNSYAACKAAISRIQSSSFQGRRLVCRLRMHSTSSLSQSSSPESAERSSATASTVSHVTPPQTPPCNINEIPLIVQSHSPRSVGSSSEVKKGLPASTGEIRKADATVQIPERYFIIKSLTVQDLVASVNNGTWEAQVHNEDLLQNAFRNTDNTYLIFSANKSGEYFGLARMTSDIYTKNLEEKACIATTRENRPQDDEPRYIMTPATDSAPSGRIYDDSTRSIIFWEANQMACDNTAASEEKSALHKQFDIEWLSTSRVPFFRLSGLRNPWNGLKEVKIARDGTELEPNVGRIVARSFRLTKNTRPF